MDGIQPHTLVLVDIENALVLGIYASVVQELGWYNTTLVLAPGDYWITWVLFVPDRKGAAH